MGYSRTLTNEHKRKISDGVRRAWARVQIAPNEDIFLNINFNEKNKDNFKVFLDDGKEIKQED